MVKTIISFTLQSRSNTIDDWYSMITVCLTPLATHVLFGLAKPVYMTQVRAPTLEWFTLANPISILWRYYAIADRRYRALNWDKLDLAGSNTLFWDGNCWNGSESILYQSRKWIIRTPDKSHTSLLSVSGFATIAVTLQGMQAIFAALSGLVIPNGLFGIQDGLPGLFLPLAVMGLLRVQAAAWVTADFEYGDECKERFHKDMKSNDSGLSHKHSHSSTSTTSTINFSHPTVPAKLQTDASVLLQKVSSSRLVPVQSARGVIFRTWWILSILIMAFVMTAVCFHGIFYGKGNNQDGIFIVTASQLGQRFLYMILIFGTLFIHAVYVMQGKNTTTVIPCVQSAWYKVFTIMMFMGMLGCLVVDALETKMTACGKSTTYPAFYKRESNVCALPN